MASLTCEQMRQLERQAFENGATPGQLMDLAGAGIARAILLRYPECGTAIACIGSGNNGGDALVALRHLADAGWSISVRIAHQPTQLAALPRKKWRELGSCPVNENPELLGKGPRVILDGLLGIGAAGPLRAPIAVLAQWINEQRQHAGADVIAMDMPSGVNGDTGEVYTDAVKADLTLTVGVPKCGLFADQAVNHVGAIETIPISELTVEGDASTTLNDLHSLSGILPRRPHDFHKGNAGRVGIVAGSPGMLGAAVLCATGALRGGAGLVTLFVHESIYPLISPMLPPEVMVRIVRDLSEVLEEKLDALAIGPGMGMTGGDLFVKLLDNCAVPMVLDADALNRIASDGLEKHLRANMLLTPHPGEMARLFPEYSQMPRAEAARVFCQQHPGVTLLLKGARTIITDDSGPVFVNGTGHAGMASGGQGDTLSGVIAGLLAQGLSTVEAARMGAWLCGRAAELAISHGKNSQQSLTASDVSSWLGMAFRELK